MKLSTILLAALPALTQVSAFEFDITSGLASRSVARQFGNGGGKSGNNGNNNNGNTGNNNGGNANGGNNNGGNNNAADSSLTLDPSVVSDGFGAVLTRPTAQDGQNPPADGQAASLTSKNNFINFCVGQTLTNGLQLEQGSCNTAPIGQIPSTDNMPSSKFVFPANGATIPANQAFTMQMAITNMKTGTFVNPDTNYFAAPQQLVNGQIDGHSHVVIEKLDSLDQTTPTDPKKFAFFKGLNEAAKNGVLTADVTDGLPEGVYRMGSINAAANHQPVIVPVAQHGMLDDIVYFTVSNNAGGNNNAGAQGGNNAGAQGGNNAGAQGGNNAGAQGGNNAGAQGGNNGGKNNGGFNNGFNGGFGGGFGRKFVKSDAFSREMN
ncbi:hypothetical protein BD626DRAFT_548326 [Schizophyllum amplum]|uniref:Uncharacterized protein n=1 Tax=Schizophyllum amplum TaxID=97359 RepID=A0A550CDS0_9AGAR|nr:hypothetical protein BD626DRAFT_548326 [Auriculariopsis ampla]